MHLDGSLVFHQKLSNNRTFFFRVKKGKLAKFSKESLDNQPLFTGIFMLFSKGSFLKRK